MDLFCDTTLVWLLRRIIMNEPKTFFDNIDLDHRLSPQFTKPVWNCVNKLRKLLSVSSVPMNLRMLHKRRLFNKTRINS